MFRSVVLIALAGCGRIGFDPTGTADGTVGGHDEDGDGVVDTVDDCPHLPGPQHDSDGDGVGDACDPRPLLGGDRIALFATMMPGDQPFTFGSNSLATWSQQDDALRLEGGPPDDPFGALRLSATFANVRLAAGIDITEIVATASQKQVALGIVDRPMYFAELNQENSLRHAQLTHYDGTNYVPTAFQPLPTGVHTGPLFFQATHTVNTGIHFEAAWPGEPYDVEVMDTVYQGGSMLVFNFNGIHFDIRYLIMITSP